MLSKPGITLEHWEKIRIQECYAWHKENKTHTAAELGIAIRTLDVKLEKYDADRREENRRAEARSQRQEDFQKRARGLSSAASGLRMEPDAQVARQPEVSLPERKEVQEVLSKQAPKGSLKRTG